jgi:prophage regulatory protein
LITRRDFPEPYQVLRMGSVWDAEDVEAWIRENRPQLDEEPES